MVDTYLQLVRAASLATLIILIVSCSGVKTTIARAAGERQFKIHCAVCHDPAIGRAPDRMQLAGLGKDEIINTLRNGSMRTMAKDLSNLQIAAIAAYLSPTAAVSVSPPPDPPRCRRNRARFSIKTTDWQNWGLGNANWRFQSKPGFSAAAIETLEPKWSFAFYGARYAQPTIAGGRVFVTSLLGDAYALDATSGCVYWQIKNARSRTTMTIARLKASPSGYAAFFGNSGNGTQTVYAVDAADGKPIWMRKFQIHALGILTGAMAFDNGRLFVPLSSAEESTSADESYHCCTFHGGIVALNAETGETLWLARTIAAQAAPMQKNRAGTQMYGPAGGAVWSAPTIDTKRESIYVATGDSYTDAKENGSDAIIAFDLRSGSVRWKSQVTSDDNYLSGCEARRLVNCPTQTGHDFDFGSPPILVPLANGGAILVAGQKSGLVYGVEPTTGRIEWKTRVGNGGLFGGVEWGMATDGVRIYVANADAYMPSPPGRPGLAALDPATGRELWFTPSPHLSCNWRGGAACLNGISSPPTVIRGIVFAGDLNGRLRAYSASSGKVLWEFDTGASTYKTVNGTVQAGGNIDGASGPVVADGMLYMMSGYFGFHGGRPTNALLVFSARH